MATSSVLSPEVTGSNPVESTKTRDQPILTSTPLVSDGEDLVFETSVRWM